LQIPCTKCPAGVEPTSPAWKAGTFAARPRAQSLQFLRRKPWDSNPQASGCSPPVFKTGPSSGRMASVRQQTFSTQSCGGRNRTCVGMINSHLPVPTRAPPQSKLLPENRRHPWLAWEKSTQRESNPHFRPGKAAGCPYIMGAFLSSWSSCQRSKNYESTGWDSNPRFRITGAESSPLNDPCLPLSNCRRQTRRHLISGTRGT
jgi:hypothetical protein